MSPSIYGAGRPANRELLYYPLRYYFSPPYASHIPDAENHDSYYQSYRGPKRDLRDIENEQHVSPS
jgi:hypothetical protein